MTRAKTKPIPVRIDKTTHRRLRGAALKMGSTTSGIIRFAVLNQLPRIESGQITLTDDKEVPA
jgi:hypothetical protein